MTRTTDRSRPLSVVGASAVVCGILLLATACAAPDGGGDQAQTPQPVATSPTPSTTEEAEPAAEPQCDTIIPAATVADFESVGWTVRAEPFRAGDVEISEGVQCIWGDFSTATDHVQIYGWAPITAEQTADIRAQLVALGWRVEQSPDGVIVTESADTTVATDAEGYGLTYLFGDGWVKYADTKQGLLLVVWPSA
jgi:hypothetical protein